jgi:hypothetical protein
LLLRERCALALSDFGAGVAAFFSPKKKAASLPKRLTEEVAGFAEREESIIGAG